MCCRTATPRTQVLNYFPYSSVEQMYFINGKQHDLNIIIYSVKLTLDPMFKQNIPPTYRIYS